MDQVIDVFPPLHHANLTLHNWGTFFASLYILKASLRWFKPCKANSSCALLCNPFFFFFKYVLEFSVPTPS